jgi:uncharacterized protein (DUF1697 family)
MTTYVAFLRAINVGGHNKIKMEDLRNIFEQIKGLKNIRTYIQSGNVLFESAETDVEKLTGNIEKSLNKSLGYPVDTVIRNSSEMKKIVDENPFPKIEVGKDWQIYICFMKELANNDAVKKLEALSNKDEEFLMRGDNLYVLCNKQPGLKLMFTNNFVEKKLGVLGTGRNWNTVNKIHAMMQ